MVSLDPPFTSPVDTEHCRNGKLNLMKTLLVGGSLMLVTITEMLILLDLFWSSEIFIIQHSAASMLL